jgi:post-segregation antitoxin (ccd killing protein)
MAFARVTVTLPTELIEDIDQLERNRSRFVQEAVRREVERRRREELRRSLRNPHGEVRETAELGYRSWAEALPAEDVSAIVDPGAGTAVRWVPEKGWTERADSPRRTPRPMRRR